MADLSSLEAAIRARGGELRDQAMPQVLNDTGQAVPVRTGYLRSSLRVEPFDDGQSLVGFDITADAPQAAFTDEGTKGPYIIRPRQAKVLAFEVDGETVFARQVVHPGIPAQHWFKEPMGDRWRDALEAAAS